jgi:transketolase
MVDYNKLQSYGPTREVLDLEPLVDKWRAFGFATTEVDGHDVAAVETALRALPLDARRPSAIVCHTVKGKGFPFAEGNPDWHHKSGLTGADIAQMYACLA